MADQKRWQKLNDFANENKDLLFMIADPATDEILFTFNLMNGFVRYPMESKTSGVVFNALRASSFETAIDAFIAGVSEGMKMKETPETGELLRNIGGHVKAFGEKTKEDRSKIIKKANKKVKNANK